MKLKFLSTVALVALTSCSYNIFKNQCPKLREHEDQAKTFRNCSYAPLWLAPVSSDYADLSVKLPKHAKVVSIKQDVYPFVLFTKTCVEAKYIEFDPKKMPPRHEHEGMMHRGEEFMKKEEGKMENFEKKHEMKAEKVSLKTEKAKIENKKAEVTKEVTEAKTEMNDVKKAVKFA